LSGAGVRRVGAALVLALGSACAAQGNRMFVDASAQAAAPGPAAFEPGTAVSPSGHVLGLNERYGALAGPTGFELRVLPLNSKSSIFLETSVGHELGGSVEVMRIDAVTATPRYRLTIQTVP